MYLTVALGCHGFHPAAWQLSSATNPFDIDLSRDLLAQAERAGFEAALFGLPIGGSRLLASGLVDACELDPLPLVGALAPRTQSIGLGATVPLSRTQPFHTARAFSVLDHLSGGRTAWVVLPPYEDEGAVIEDAAYPALSRSEWYERAAEYISVVIKLWDSWEDGCVLADKEAGIFADSRRVHPIDHVGPYFSVQGPLTAIRPLQGRPVVVQFDQSDAGLKLAAQTADVFIGMCSSPEEAIALREKLHALLDGASRPRSAVKFLLSVWAVIEPTETHARHRADTLDSLISSDLMRAIKEDRERLAGRHLPNVLSGHRWGVRFVGTASRLCNLMIEWSGAGLCDGFNIVPSILPDTLLPLFDELARRRRPVPGEPVLLRQRLGLIRPVSVFAATTSATA